MFSDPAPVLSGPHAISLQPNPRVARERPIGPRERAVLNPEGHAQAAAEIATWRHYAPTPLHALGGLAQAAGLGAIHYKDESGRFGLGSFKALGGAYAVKRLIRREGAGRPVAELTVCCATDGNHGRSVAWGAHLFGCRCVIYIHATVSQGRADAIARWGAEVRRVTGNYDDAVRQAATDAAREGWFVVSDTSYPGYMTVPCDVMHGYTLMVQEAIDQLVEQGASTPTHVFVQGGVGGLAAAVVAQCWEAWGEARPRMVVVEPEKAACLFESVRAGVPTVVHGALDTVMAGLACGEVSLLAWEILDEGVHDFVTIDDAAALACMVLLADGRGDPPIVAGESATAGLAACLLAAGDPHLRDRLGLNHDSRILIFGTEGATDPALYEQIVGRKAEAVRA